MLKAFGIQSTPKNAESKKLNYCFMKYVMLDLRYQDLSPRLAPELKQLIGDNNDQFGIYFAAIDAVSHDIMRPPKKHRILSEMLEVYVNHFTKICESIKNEMGLQAFIFSGVDGGNLFQKPFELPAIILRYGEERPTAVRMFELINYMATLTQKVLKKVVNTYNPEGIFYNWMSNSNWSSYSNYIFHCRRLLNLKYINI